MVRRSTPRRSTRSGGAPSLWVAACTVALAAGVLAEPAMAEHRTVVVADEMPGDVPVMAVGSRTNTGLSVVKTFYDPQGDGNFQVASSFTPYPTKLADGVRVATGDFNADGNDELVTSTDGADKVTIWELTSSGVVGAPICSIPGFPQGTFVATADLNADGNDELVTGRDAGGAPAVVIRADLHSTGCPSSVTNTLQPYPANWTGGVRVAAGDVNNNGGDELVTAPGPGHVSLLKVFTDADGDLAVTDHPLVDQFQAFASSFTGGVHVAAGHSESMGTNGAEIFAAIGSGANPRVVVRTDVDGDGKVSDDPVFDTVKPYPSSFTGGIRVSAADSDSSGSFVELQVAPGASSGTLPIKIFDDNAEAGSRISDNPIDDQFTAFPSTTKAGSYIAVGAVRSGTYPSAPATQPIPDLGTINSVLNVPASAGSIKDLAVDLNIAHTFDADLDVTLTHVPTGTSLPLFNDVGGTDAGFQIRLDDEAGTDIATADNPADGSISGFFNPIGSNVLSVFDGEDASGKWVLTITDDSGGDTGTLMSWALVVTY